MRLSSLCAHTLVFNMKLSIFTNKKGFTLVELLTVISIISILTALLTVSFVSVSQRGRDAQRKSNIRQIQAALELYRADNDAYPPAVSNSIGSSTTVSVACNQPFVVGGITYMQKMPCDPEGTNVKYFYSSTSPYSTYGLVSCLDNTGDREAQATKPFAAMTDCNPATYFYVTNP